MFLLSAVAAMAASCSALVLVGSFPGLPEVDAAAAEPPVFVPPKLLDLEPPFEDPGCAGGGGPGGGPAWDAAFMALR